ncbi:adenylyl-sulfate kinase [Terrabacter sp. BE26]|uniref:adenylyl-sulfate kinase n=1 Tax=Terrabacter sp. BE26 TaxID=2898152 RepID=UPI0035BE5485
MTITTAVPVLTMSATEIRDVELVLGGVLPSGHLLGGPVAAFTRRPARTGGPVCAGLLVDADLARLATAAGGITLVDQEHTPLASLTALRTGPAALADGEQVVVTGTVARERLRESGPDRALALDLDLAGGAYGGLVVFGRPALTWDDRRLEMFLHGVRRGDHGARVLVVVPDQAVDTAGVPTLLMAQLAARSVDRVCSGCEGVRVDVATAPLPRRDPVSDEALVGALAAHVGARDVLVLSDDLRLDDAAEAWREVVGLLDGQLDGQHDGQLDGRPQGRRVDRLDHHVVSACLHPDDRAALSRWRPPRSRRGLVVMFTGLSGSGKSTLARSLAARISRETSRTVSLLDGDVVRQLLSQGLGFDHESRLLNIRRIGFVAAEVARHGGVAICAPVAPYARARDDVRAMVGEVGDFVLVHVSTPLEECERRDLKGLYAKARAGLVPSFTGISDPYEAPTDADLTIDTTALSSAAAVDRLFDYLAGGGWLETGTS